VRPSRVARVRPHRRRKPANHGDRLPVDRLPVDRLPVDRLPLADPPVPRKAERPAVSVVARIAAKVATVVTAAVVPPAEAETVLTRERSSRDRSRH